MFFYLFLVIDIDRLMDSDLLYHWFCFIELALPRRCLLIGSVASKMGIQMNVQVYKICEHYSMVLYIKMILIKYFSFINYDFSMQSDNDSHVSMHGIIDFMVPKIINFIVSRLFIVISVFHYHIVSTDLIWLNIIKLFFRGKTTPILTHNPPPFTIHYGLLMYTQNVIQNVCLIIGWWSQKRVHEPYNNIYHGIILIYFKYSHYISLITLLIYHV